MCLTYRQYCAIIRRTKRRGKHLQGKHGGKDMNDMVNNPQHYQQGDIECIDCIKAATADKIGIEAFCVGNAIKYLYRYNQKNGLEDARKSAWYINRLIQELESEALDETEEYDCCECEYSNNEQDEYPCSKCKNNMTVHSDEWYHSSYKFKHI